MIKKKVFILFLCSLLLSGCAGIKTDKENNIVYWRPAVSEGCMTLRLGQTVSELTSYWEENVNDILLSEGKNYKVKIEPVLIDHGFVTEPDINIPLEEEIRAETHEYEAFLGLKEKNVPTDVITLIPEIELMEHCDVWENQYSKAVSEGILMDLTDWIYSDEAQSVNEALGSNGIQNVKN